MMRWLYKQITPWRFHVGFYGADGEWNFDSEHHDREAAASRVHWLNGGNGSAVEMALAHSGG